MNKSVIHMSRKHPKSYAIKRPFLETLKPYMEATLCRTLDNFFLISRERATPQFPLNEQISNFKGEKTMKQTKLNNPNEPIQKPTKQKETTFKEVKT